MCIVALFVPMVTLTHVACYLVRNRFYIKPNKSIYYFISLSSFVKPKKCKSKKKHYGLVFATPENKRQL